MKHIQSCAKKNRLTDETVRVLLRTELANLPPVASSSRSKLPAGPPTSSTPETLLEETLKDQRRKRSGPRKQVEQTVKNVSETRDSILDKARLLLQTVRDGVPVHSVHKSTESSTSSTDSGSAMPPATQAFARSSVAVRNDLRDIQPADITQAFGSSRLGVARIPGGIVNAGAAIAGESDVSPLTQVFTRSALAPAMADIDPADDMPPATQVFAPSKLTNGAGATRKVVPTHGASLRRPNPPRLLTSVSRRRDGRPYLAPRHLRGRVRPEQVLSRTASGKCHLHLPCPDETDNNQSVIEIPSSPSSNANRLPPPSTATSPRAAAIALDLRSPSPLARGPSPAGDEGWPAYDEGPEFNVQNEYGYQWNPWDDEQNLWDEYDGGGDAFLHYDPDGDADAGPLTQSGSKGISAPTTLAPASPPARRQLAAISEDVVPVAGPSRTRDEPVPPPIEPATKKKRGRPKKVTTDESDAEPGADAGKDVPQEELNAKLKEAILKDEVLHLRILRYEVCMSLVTYLVVCIPEV